MQIKEKSRIKQRQRHMQILGIGLRTTIERFVKMVQKTHIISNILAVLLKRRNCKLEAKIRRLAQQVNQIIKLGLLRLLGPIMLKDCTRSIMTLTSSSEIAAKCFAFPQILAILSVTMSLYSTNGRRPTLMLSTLLGFRLLLSTR